MNPGKLVLGILFVAALPTYSIAHPAQLVAATANLQLDGRFQINATFDVLAFALNDTPAAIDDASMNELLDGPREVLESRLAESRARFLRSFAVVCQTRASPLPGAQLVHAQTIEFPSVDEVYRRSDSASRSMRLPIIAEATLAGQLPRGTTSIAFRFPEAMGPMVLTVQRPDFEPYSEPVEAGQSSSTLAVNVGGAPQSDEMALASRDPSRFEAALKYLHMGFGHIVPAGPDHILFVLGLFPLSTRLRPLLWQVTAFTVAHSITLALALYGIVRPPAMIVEPLIAVSIAFVAVENLFTTDMKPWRPIVVFGFGLIHGLGFASVLSAAGLSRAQFAPALLSFNIGVELGQLAVIALAFAAVGWWQRRAWYRWIIVLPTSAAIAAVAVCWTIQRVYGAI